MELSGNTILITGGSSGIGLQLAKQLIAKNNSIIICGRSHSKLLTAKQEIPGLNIFACDISNEEECKRLFLFIKNEYPGCNILINNAAIVHKTDFFCDEKIATKANAEIATNLSAPITLTKLFCNMIGKDTCGMVVNITSGLALVPRDSYPIYNATKAALHSFTQTIRAQNRNPGLYIIEVMFPVVDTPWHQGQTPAMAISPETAVKEMIMLIEKGKTEIRIGKVKLLYLLFRISPVLARKILNRNTSMASTKTD